VCVWGKEGDLKDLPNDPISSMNPKHTSTYTHTHRNSLRHTPARREEAEDRQHTVTFILHLPPILAMYSCVCACVLMGGGVSGNEFKEIIIVICARLTLVAPAIAAGVVAGVSCLLMHLPFLLLSASGCM